MLINERSKKMSKDNIFERVEQKYRLDDGQKEAFLSAVEDRIHVDQYGYHTIHNIYYDTDHYDLIRNSIEKPKYKEKFRVRAYGEINGNSLVYLEIKKKYKGIVYKRRAALSVEEADAFLKKGMMPQNADQIMKEIQYFFSFYHPEPKVYLAYDRTAYVGTDDEELRITMDDHIRSREDNLDFTYGSGGRLLDADHHIMEIKVMGAYPVWLSGLLSELCIFPVSFSKYGTVYKRAVRAGETPVKAGITRQEPELKELQAKGEQICLPVY